MAVDPIIQQKAEDIRMKIYGEQVRESLASGLEAMSSDVVEVEGRQDEVESQFQDVIENTTDKDVVSAPEIIAARNGEANLKARLDKENQEVTAQLAQIETNLNSISTDLIDYLDPDGGINRFSDAFNSALTYLEQKGGGRLNVTAGEFVITERIDIPSDVSIIGSGVGVSVVKSHPEMNANAHTAIWANKNRESGDKNITIIGLSSIIDKTEQDRSHNLTNMDFLNCENIRIQGNEVVGSIEYEHSEWVDIIPFGGRGNIFFRKTSYSYIINNIVSEGDYNTIALYEDSNYNLIIGNRVSKNGYDYTSKNSVSYVGGAIQETANRGRKQCHGNKYLYNLIYDNDILYNDDNELIESNGFISHSGTGFDFSYNHVYDSAGDAIRVLDHNSLPLLDDGSGLFLGNATISHNTIKRTKRSIHTDEAAGIFLEANNIGANGQYIIWNQVSIESNFITKTAGSGIIAKHVNSLIIKSNNIYSILLDRTPTNNFGVGGIIALSIRNGIIGGNQVVTAVNTTNGIHVGEFIKDPERGSSLRVLVNGNLLRSAGEITENESNGDIMISGNLVK